MINQDKYVISNVNLWGADGCLDRVSILVEDGVTRRITQEDLSDLGPVINGEGKVLLPAGVDPQVHLRVPGQYQKETALSGLKAAIRGGIGALLTMPNTKPVIDDRESCQLANQELAPAELETGVKVLLSAAITKGQKGLELVDFDSLIDENVAAFTDDGVGVMSDELMASALKVSAETGIPLLQHAETTGHGGILAEGPLQRQLDLTPYPASAETDMVARDLRLLRDFPKARYHVLHISSRDTLALVGEAKQNGLKASCEVSPHHLWFCSDDIDDSNSSFKMNPPLRSDDDRRALQIALETGTIDFVATDHAPHETEIKSLNFKTAAYGTIGMETSLRVLLSLHTQGKLSPQRLVHVFSTAPAKFLGLDDSYGQIKEGAVMRSVLVDLSKQSQVTVDDFAGQSTNSCFIGAKLQGSIDSVMLGRLVHVQD